MEINENCCCSREYKNTGRSDEEKLALRNRINRIIGQLGGIAKMIDEDRYCGAILMQVSAATSAIRNLGYILLEEHLSSCVKDDVLEGKEPFPEVMDLIKNLR